MFWTGLLLFFSFNAVCNGLWQLPSLYEVEEQNFDCHDLYLETTCSLIQIKLRWHTFTHQKDSFSFHNFLFHTLFLNESSVRLKPSSVSGTETMVQFQYEYQSLNFYFPKPKLNFFPFLGFHKFFLRIKINPDLQK